MEKKQTIADNPEHQKYFDWLDDLYWRSKVEAVSAAIENAFPELHNQPELVDKIGDEWRSKLSDYEY